jgi:ectoine hydroxylase
MLTRAQLDEFSENGYVRIPNVYSASEVQQMRAACERLEAAAAAMTESGLYRGSYVSFETVKSGPLVGTRAIRFITWCGSSEPVLERYTRDARLLGKVCQLLDTRMLYQTLNNLHPKLPNSQVEYVWHQDTKFSGYGTDVFADIAPHGSYVSTALAVDAMDDSNGPLMFVPGSHKLGHLRDHEELLRHCERAVPIHLEAGDIFIFHHFAIHGSFANQSSRSRRVLKNVFAHPGAFRRWNHHGAPGRMVELPDARS